MAELLTKPPILLFTFVNSSQSTSFVPITTNINNLQSSGSCYFNVKNINTGTSDLLYIKHSSIDHGNNTGFVLDVGESIDIGCGSITNIEIKVPTNKTISFQVTGYK